ncbi:WG repeat-containing protein [Pontibacillus litoralis]|uniref:Membrane protein n=1 Tax=Pontibacillus litoralis JSM 072002 TaxID=1385512 RepID=A0A0A5GAG0_9BACI|nr:WG repeat-containing protein [Pontibacillus litoralis]KGX88188.1 membrane protein [Pontibacillus litoralis JSM 072002]
MYSKLFPAYVHQVGGRKWGYIGNNGIFRISPQWGQARNYQQNGLAVVMKDDLYGVINGKGSYIVRPFYQYITDYQDERAIASHTNGASVLDSDGNVVTTQLYDYIGSYHEGLAVFNQDTRYGYLNKNGEEAIPAQFVSATPFVDGKAIVQIEEQVYALISKTGKQLHTYRYPFVGQYGNGLLVFQAEEDGKYGYVNEAGKIIIKPSFDGAQAFQGGRAVVYRIVDGKYNDGLIDKSGIYIMKPIYDDIQLLGENRVAAGKALVEDKPFLGRRYAIATTNGVFLTDYVYENVLPYDQGLASVQAGDETFFINRKGTASPQMPKLQGQGFLSLSGKIIKAVVNFETIYVNRDGSTIYKPNKTIRLNNQYRVVRRTYHPNRDYLVYYPMIGGMPDVNIEKEVNHQLRDLSQVKPVDEEKQLEYTYFGDFDVFFFRKQLVVFELDGSLYYFGAAHPMPTKVFANIDLISGVFYELKDLFKTGSNYVEVLSAIIAQQIESGDYSYVFPGSYQGISPNQPFYVDEEHLYIYFNPYEIAPYVAGFVTFTIPFVEIMDIIKRNGDFWSSFHEE